MFKLIKNNLKGSAVIAAIFAPVFMFVEVFMDLQQPTLMSHIIDIGVANGDLGYVLRTGARMIIYALIGLVGGAACGILANYAAMNMGGSIRKNLFSKIFSLSTAEFDKLQPSSLITRLTSDVSQVQEMFVMMLRAMSRAPMMFIGGIIMAFMLSPRLALILCAALPVLFAFMIFIIRYTLPLYSKVQYKLDRLNVVVRENLLGIKVVKSFLLEDKQISSFENANAEYKGSSIKAQKTTFMLMPVVMLVMNLSVVAVLWFGGMMQINGILPTGRIMAFVNYVVQITNSLAMLVGVSVFLSRSRASADRIIDTMSVEPTVCEPANPKMPNGGEIVFENVSFRHGQGEPVLMNISLKIPSGQKVGIIGPTGCGKTTLAALMVRLYDATEGKVTLGGVDIKEISFEELHKKSGIIMQESLLFSGTVEENLKYGNESADEALLWKAAEASQADEFLKDLADGLKAEVAQRGKNFSGGQKQRLNIARSIVHKPDILIMDDSTSAVDLITEAKLQKTVDEIMCGATRIIIAQRISTIMECDNIFVMDKGRIVNEGTHSELIESSDIYRSIALSQLGEEALHG